MAYINKSGVITIDEDAARADMRREAQAVQILNDAARQLRSVISEAQEYQGETVNAIIERAGALLKQTEKLIGNLEETQDYTQRVVVHYQELDRKCRAELEALAKKG